MDRKFQAEHADRKMSFRVPEGFFEELPRLTTERLNIEIRRRHRRMWTGIAAVAVPFAACLVLAVVFRFSDHRNTEYADCRLDGTEVFDRYLQELSDEELTNLAADASLDPNVLLIRDEICL